MSELSDIQLRIRVEVVNSASLLALSSSMNKVDAVSKKVKASSKTLAGSFSTLGDGFTRTTSAATRQRQATAALARGYSVLTQSAGRLGASGSRNTALNARLANGVQVLTAKTVASSSATTRSNKVNRDLARGLATLQGESTKTANAIASASAKEKQAIDRATLATKRLAEEKRRLNSVSARLGRGFEAVTKQLSKVERNLDAVFRAGVHLQSMGRDLLGFAKRVGTAAMGAADAWGEFEFNLNRAAGAMDIFDTKSPMYQKLKDSIIAMTRELRLVPADEAALAMYHWQSTTGQSIDTADKLKTAIMGVKTALQVATLTQTDNETVIKGAYSIMRQYGMSLSDIPQIMKDLFVATQRTSLEFTDLIQSFKFAGPIAKGLGSSFTDVAKWVGMIGDLGQRGSISGRGLAMMFTQIVRPSKAAVTAYNKLFKAQLGVKDGYNKLVFPKGKFVGFEKLITTLAKSMKGLTQQQKYNYLTTITGTQNSARIILPLIDAQVAALAKGANAFSESKYSMAGSAKVFEKAWGLLSGSWKGTVGLLKQSVMPIILSVGEAIAKQLTPILNELSDALWEAKPALEAITKEVSEALAPAIDFVGKLMKKALVWFKSNPKIAKQLALWAALGTVIAGVGGAVLLAVGTFIFLLNSVVLIVAGMVPMLGMFAAASALVASFASSVFRNVGGIQQSFGRLFTALAKFFKMFLFGGKDSVSGVKDLAKSLQGMMDGAVKKLAPIIDAIASALDKITPGQVTALQNIAKALLALKVLDVGLGVFTGTLKLMVGQFSNLVDGAKGLIKYGPKATAILKKMFAEKAVAEGAEAAGAKAGGGFLGGLVGSIAGGIMGAVTSLAGAFSMAGVSIAGFVVAWPVVIAVAIAAAFIAAYATNFFGFKDFIDGIGRFFTEVAIPAIMQFAVDVYNAFATGVADFLTFLAGIGDWFAALPGVIAGFLGQIITNIVTFVGEVGNNILTFLQGIADNFGYYLGFVIGFVIGFVAKFLYNIISFGITLVQNIIGFLVQLPANFIKFFGEVAVNIGNWFKTNIPLFIAKAGEIINGIIDWFRKLPGRIADFFGSVLTNISGWFTTNIPTIAAWAGDLVQKVIDFFISLPGKIVDAIKGLPKLIGDIINGMAKIGGVVWTAVLGVGENIVKGIWQGITNFAGWLADQVKGFIDGIVAGVNQAIDSHSPSRVFAEIGENMVLGLAVGIENTDAASKSLANLMTGLTAQSSALALAPSSLTSSFSSSSSRDLNLNVNVTSADGSVNQMDMNTLAGLINGSDMARSLERMASVD